MRSRNALHRAGAWIAGEPFANIIGRALTALLIIAIIAIVLAIVYVGAMHAIADIRAEDIGRQLRAIVIFVIGIVAFAAAVAVVPSLIRSLWEQVGWWTNVFRLLALTVIVFAVWVAAPLVLPQLPGGRWFAWLERAESESVEGEPVGLVPPSLHALPSDIAAIRREAILRKYWRFLAHYGDEGLRRRYERVTQWRSLVDQYAQAANLDRTKIEAIMMTESAGQPEITSRANARGLLQVLDESARRRVDLCGTRDVPRDSYDPEKNICVGTDELRTLVNVKYHGDWENAYAAFNWGATRLDRAIAWTQQKLAPRSPPSFWALWDKRDSAYVDTLPDPEAKGDKNPEGWLLFNYGKNPDETRYYVPSVLAWEYIIRYMDAHGGTPPPRDGNREPPLLARRGPAPRPQPDEGDEGWEDDFAETPTPDQQPHPSLRPTSRVWYTLRSGEDIGHAIIIFGEPTEEIAKLNPGAEAHGGAAGTMVYLPEKRYAFYRPSGSESYRDIAIRHGMTTAELLQWAGRWTTEDVWAAGRRDCPPEGCDDELALASTSEQLLVRKQN